LGHHRKLIAGKNWLNLRAEQKLKGSSATITPAVAAPVAH
jgi:hypothetical protein